MTTAALRYPRRLVPKLVETLRTYSRSLFVSDLIAGITVGIVALPLAMAFAISSGVKPEAGIYTAVLAGLIVSGLGGSRCQIAGPTGAFVVIVAGIVAKYGVSGLLQCTLMAGVMLVLMAVTGLGAAVRYIPRAVTIGFTNGIAVLIASTQLKDFFGLAIPNVPSEFAERLSVLAEHAHTFSTVNVFIAALSLIIMILWRRLNTRMPPSLMALLVATGVCLLFDLRIETIGSRFGGIPAGMPAISMPHLQADLLIPLLPSAMTVALLAAIESLLSAVVADTMSGDRHKPDAELFAQGIANLAVPFFGGIPVTGAIARTATNIRSGAKTPVAGIIHSATLLFILLAAAPLAKFIPLATLAAVLMIVAYNMGEWREIPHVLRLSGAERLVWCTTFLLTVFADLTIAVQVGMLLAALLYILQVTETTTVSKVTEDYLRDGRAHVLQGKDIPAEVTTFRIHGPFLFGATNKLEDATADLHDAGSIIVLRLRNMTAIDGTGLHALEHFAQRIQKSGRELVVCGLRRQPAALVQRSGLPELIGQENILPHVEAALERAAQLLQVPKLRNQTLES